MNAQTTTSARPSRIGVAQPLRLKKIDLESWLSTVNELLSIKRFLYLFWGSFWLLNGLDKFFNGYMINGENVGWFGVYRDPKMIAYFERLFLPPELALAFLYSMGVFEIMVGVAFLIALVYPALSKSTRHLAFKSSMLIFALFSVGDILFGDRMELWEHGTFMILALLSFRLYLDYTVQRHDTTSKEEKHSLPTLPAPIMLYQKVSYSGYSAMMALPLQIKWVKIPDELVASTANEVRRGEVTVTSKVTVTWASCQEK